MMHSPPHPGDVLKETVVDPLGLTVPEAAHQLDLPGGDLANVLAGKAAISPDLAARLEQAGISTAQFWLNLQSNYDLWQAGRA